MYLVVAIIFGIMSGFAAVVTFRIREKVKPPVKTKLRDKPDEAAHENET